jgi:hypothetical protein
VALTRSAERLLKNVNFNGLLSTIRLRHGGDADERIALYVRHRALGDRDNGSAVLERNVGFLAALQEATDRAGLSRSGPPVSVSWETGF